MLSFGRQQVPALFRYLRKVLHAQIFRPELRVEAIKQGKGQVCAAKD